MVTAPGYAGNSSVDGKHELMLTGDFARVPVLIVATPGYPGSCGVGGEYELMLTCDCVRVSVVSAVSMS